MSGYQRKPSAPLWHLCPTDQLSNGTPRHGAAAPDAEPGALRSGYGPSCRRVEGELGSVRRCKGAEWRHWFSAAVGCIHCAAGLSAARVRRSEEHTSELQSLMRISYAVFCLKKKKKLQTSTNDIKSKKQKRKINETQVY